MAGKSRPSRSPRTNDPQAMRARVLDAAAELFQTRGFHGASMHDVKRAAGVSGGAMAHHFPTKKALGLAVLAERVAVDVEQTWIAPFARPRPAGATARAIFDATAAELDRRGSVRGCPLNNLALELSLVDSDYRKVAENLFERWRLAIERRLRQDGRDPEQAAAAATAVVALFSGAMAMAKACQGAEPVRACRRLLDAIPGLS